MADFRQVPEQDIIAIDSLIPPPLPLSDDRRRPTTTGRAYDRLIVASESRALRRAMPAMLVTILIVDRFVLGSDWLPLHAAADVLCNVLTGIIWVLAARSLGIPLAFTSGVFAAVVIDLDHIPEFLGLLTPVPGTSRIFTHSLATALTLLVVGLIDRSRRMAWAGAAWGVVAHLTRDLATGTVIVWWPVSTELVSIPYAAYVGLTAGLVAVGWLSVYQDESTRDQVASGVTIADRPKGDARVPEGDGG